MSQAKKERERGTLEQVGEQIGAAAGNIVGRGTDVAVGMIGSLLGAAAQSLGDWWSTSEADRASRSFDPDKDRSCRSHFEAENPRPRDYDEVRPLYQFGHTASQNPAYQGRDFDEVEPDLQRAWESGPRENGSDWPEVRGYVGFGYSQENSEDLRNM